MRLKTYYLSLVTLSCFLASLAQPTRTEMMNKLNFLTGEWIGTATLISNDSITSAIPAFEKIEYKLNKSILTIDLHSKSLQLHTVIYYDETDQCFYYNPFYKTGAAKYRAKLINNQLVIYASETKRFYFTLNNDQQFIEYGEQLDNGIWRVYFRDTFDKL